MDNPHITSNGDKRWYDSNGYFHRDNGPAIEHTDGSKQWYQHGNRHRDDGPAVQYSHGTKYWYLYGKYLSFNEWLDEVDISDEDKVMMKLQYG
jgi:hypothetical protein